MLAWSRTIHIFYAVTSQRIFPLGTKGRRQRDTPWKALTLGRRERAGLAQPWEPWLHGRNQKSCSGTFPRLLNPGEKESPDLQWSGLSRDQWCSPTRGINTATGLREVQGWSAKETKEQIWGLSAQAPCGVIVEKKHSSLVGRASSGIEVSLGERDSAEVIQQRQEFGMIWRCMKDPRSRRTK